MYKDDGIKLLNYSIFYQHLNNFSGDNLNKRKNYNLLNLYNKKNFNQILINH